MEKGKRVVRYLALFVFAVAVSGPGIQARAASQGSLTCSSCHGMAPLDSPTRNPATGGFPGNHRTHAPASSAAVDHCSKCHVVSGFTARHRDGKISFQPNINTSPLTGEYRVGGRAVTFRNQTAVPMRGSCANANCHFESATPVWGSEVFSSTADCSACHTVPGSSAGHGKHIQYYPGFTGCTKCHPDWATGLRFAHATSAAKRGIRIALTEGTYSGSGGNFLPSQIASRSFGTCNNTYCHSDGKASPASVPATWGGSGLPADCSGCHGNASGTTLSGKHAQHVNNAGYLGTNLKCADCHGKTVGSASDTAIVDRSKHVNRFIDYSGAKAGRNGKDCSNIYCHSDGKGNGVDPGSWTTGAPMTGCKGCHGAKTVAQGAAFDSVAGEPNYLSAGAGGHRANSHGKHVGAAGESSCDTCHYLTTTTGNAIVSGSTRHLDGTLDVTLNLSKAGASAQWVAGKTCNNIACHSGRSAQWGAPGNCDLCHPASSLKGAHAKHLSGATPAFYSYTGNHSFGDDSSGKYEFGCSNCHPLVTGNHIDGQVLLDFRPVVSGQGLGVLRGRNRSVITASGVAGAAGGTDPTSVPGSKVICLNLYCHSNGYGANPIYATTPDWYGGTFAGDRCANCHGNSPSVGIPGSTAHASHVVGIHWQDIFSGTIGKLSTGASGSVSHGVAGQSTTMNCDTCHAATISISRNDKGSACSGCHSAGTNLSQIGSRARHVNGIVEISLKPVTYNSKAQLRPGTFSQYTAAGGYWDRNANNYKNGAGAFDTTKSALSGGSWGGGSCSNVACHMFNPVNWTETNLECNNCHGSL